MPTLKVSRSGLTVSRPPVKPGPGGDRGEVNGWSIRAARRCDAFLRSVLFDEIQQRGLVGYALTLTVAERPESHVAWARLVKRLRQRLERRGMVCGHFVTEWQPRGRTSKGPCPHLHLVVFFPEGAEPEWSDGFCSCIGADALKVHWLEVADAYGPLLHGQHVEIIKDLVGWFRYLAKHAARGVHHYQRSTELLPEGWVKTGRMWGTWGDWPTFEYDGKMSVALFFALRRFATRYQLASARSDLARSRQRLADARNLHQTNEGRKFIAMSLRRLRYLKRRLQRSDMRLSVIVPVSEWMPADVTARWLDETAHQGEVMNIATGEVRPFYSLPGDVEPPPQGWEHLDAYRARTERHSAA